jgi:hypothetical protein
VLFLQKLKLPSRDGALGIHMHRNSELRARDLRKMLYYRFAPGLGLPCFKVLISSPRIFAFARASRRRWARKLSRTTSATKRAAKRHTLTAMPTIAPVLSPPPLLLHWSDVWVNTVTDTVDWMYDGVAEITDVHGFVELVVTAEKDPVRTADRITSNVCGDEDTMDTATASVPDSTTASVTVINGPSEFAVT